MRKWQEKGWKRRRRKGRKKGWCRDGEGVGEGPRGDSSRVRTQWDQLGGTGRDGRRLLWH